MLRRNRWWLVSLGATYAVSGLVGIELRADEKRSLLILTSSPNEVPISFAPQRSERNENVEFKLKEIQPEKSSSNRLDDPDVETIRERFPNGRDRIEKQVALDANGDFKNHGLYQEWTMKGEIVATGNFEMGLRQGPWIKMCRTQDSKLFESYPYSQFKSPFQSTVDFASDKMNGVWTIIDADKRIVSQIALTDGIRNGVSTWFHPNGKILFQADYRNGILDGTFVEKGQDERVVRNEQYTEGKRIEVEREFYPSKVLKSEISYLTASPAMTNEDDWVTNKLAVYDKAAEKVKHGAFQSFFDNGQLKSKGSYALGTLTGEFESYYSNGQKESVGGYVQGKQDGKWTWWHANGMRATSATYSQGHVAGEVLAWNDAGARVTNPKVTLQRPSLAEEPAMPRQAAKLPSNR